MTKLTAFVRQCLVLVGFVLCLSNVPSAAEDSAAEGEGVKADAFHYVELDALTVTIFRNDAPAGVFTTKIVIQLQSAEVRDVVASNEVRLRDAMLRELHRLLEREERSGPKVDLDRVKRRMLRVSRRQLGPDIVEDVLVQALVRHGA